MSWVWFPRNKNERSRFGQRENLNNDTDAVKALDNPMWNLATGLPELSQSKAMVLGLCALKSDSH